MPRAFGQRLPPVFQLPALLNQPAPVQNTWYTILNTTPNCLIWEVDVRIDTTGETLEWRITIDGVVSTAIGNACLANTDYWGVPVLYNVGLYTEISAVSTWRSDRAFIVEGRSIKIEVRKTTAAGAGNLRGAVAYSRY